MTLVPLITPTSSPILPPPSKHPKLDVVLFYGYPCLGKSFFFRKHFQAVGYTHINQDTLRTRDKCIQRLQQALKDGKSCVIGMSNYFILVTFVCMCWCADNANRDIQTRKYYIDLAKKHGHTPRLVPLFVPTSTKFICRWTGAFGSRAPKSSHGITISTVHIIFPRLSHFKK
jgi:hypothetical protein